MTSIFTRLRSFFSESDKLSGVNELYRLESDPVRQIDRIEECIIANFGNDAGIQWKIGYFIERLQTQLQLKQAITYLLIFKDLVSIGPERACTAFLVHRPKLQNYEILRLFSSYLTKIAFTRQLYGECLQAYNDQQSHGDCLKAYKAINLLTEVFTILDLILGLNHQQAYHRLCMCLISDAVLFFVYIKQTLLRHTPQHMTTLSPEEQSESLQQEDTDQLLSVAEEFCRISSDVRRVLFEFKFENCYYKLQEQKAIATLRRSLKTQAMVEKQYIHGLADRDPNQQQKQRIIITDEFSFGVKIQRRLTDSQ